MKTYNLTLRLEVSVDAFEEVDAIEAAEDIFGVGQDCGIEVKNFEVLDCVELGGC